MLKASLGILRLGTVTLVLLMDVMNALKTEFAQNVPLIMVFNSVSQGIFVGLNLSIARQSLRNTWLVKDSPS